MFENIKKVLIITDLDGTLLPKSKVVSPKTLDAIKKFTGDGGKFSIATGRAIQSTTQYFDAFPINAPIVLCNGGMIYDIQKNKSIYNIFLPDFTKQVVRKILDDNPDTGCEILRPDNVWAVQINEFEETHLTYYKTVPERCSLDEMPDDWNKILFADSSENLEKLIEYVEKSDIINCGLEFVRSAKSYYEILPPNVTKGSAVDNMRKLCGMQDYTIVAAGDYNNDIAMLKAADIAVCPSNAVDDVKQVCDIVSEYSCEQDFMAHVIDMVYNRLKK